MVLAPRVPEAMFCARLPLPTAFTSRLLGSTMLLRFSTRLTFSACALAALTACSHGGAEAAAPAPAPAMIASAVPPGVTPATIAMGDSIFKKGSCQRCHGMDAKGTPRGPDLTDGTWSQITGTYSEIVDIITTGVPKAKIKMAGAPFGMNARGGNNLTDEQIRAVAAYVHGLSHH
jgi:mono/diheme cytochrome c family protein